MFKVEKQQNLYEDIILKDTESGVIATVTPQKGGMLTSLVKDNREYIYVDKKTYNVEGHGGCAVPVLFPTVGRTKNEILTFDNKQYQMGIHGLVRDYKWKVISTNVDGGASVTIAVKSDEESKKHYPFDYEMRLTYILNGNNITTKQEYLNCGDKTMPFSFGFHPYFCISHCENLDFDLSADRVINATTSESTEFSGNIDFDAVYALGAIYKVTKNQVAFKDKKDNIKVKIKYDNNFKYVVIWSNLKDKFVCVEPWSSIPNSLNTKIDVTNLEAHKSLEAQYTIEIE